jgi:hypothetical protein
LTSGPISEKFSGNSVKRIIEIRGDQTLDHPHHAIFDAYDRWEFHKYEFQFGKYPFDPEALTYGVDESSGANRARDASTTTLDDLQLKEGHIFGYWFDFGDNWFHQIDVERVVRAIPTVTYPRVTKRVGKSPPQ